MMRDLGRASGRLADSRWAGVTFALVGCLAASAQAAEKPVTCTTCHPRQQREVERSVHHSLDCRECHGGDKSFSLSSEQAAPFQSPGRSLLSFDHGESFRAKPRRVDVPNLCGDCHADVERMNPYGLQSDQLARYWTSVHGKKLKQDGDERVAICIDCHGSHEILSGRDPASRTHPLNVPDTCGTCHGDAQLMGEYGLPVEVVDEYRMSVHGRLLSEQHDTGAPTCATCHGNHSAMPPGFASVGAVCGQCHRHAAEAFDNSIHADQPEHKRCVQCHGGGEGRYFHLIERITKGPAAMIQRYAHLLTSDPEPSLERVTETIHPDPKQIIERALPTCMDCHDDFEDDESLPKLFDLLDEIAKAEQYYVRTGNRLDRVGQGVLLVDNQRFKLEDAKTHLIELAPLQHTLDNSLVREKVSELNAICDEINVELDALEEGLRWRHVLLIPIWVFALFFGSVLYAKYKLLKRAYVKPMPPNPE